MEREYTKVLTESFEDSIGLQDLLLDPGGDVGSDRAQVLQDELGRFRFASSGLSGDDQRLVDAFCLKGFVGCLCQGKYMRRQGTQLLAMIGKHTFLQYKN